MEVYVSGAIAALISAVVGAIVGGVIGYLSRRRRQEHAEDELLLCLSRAQLFDHYRTVIERGYTTPQEIEVWEPMHSAYSRGGGNGVIDRLHATVAVLPVKPD